MSDRSTRTPRQQPSATGLYDPAFEHDACGVAFVARLNGVPSHETVERALRAVANLEHRGAQGADPDTGDGAGVLVQIPDAFFRAEVGERLPRPGAYAVGMCFLPGRRRAAGPGSSRSSRTRSPRRGSELLGWRDVPVDLRQAGTTARGARPVHAPGGRRRLGRARRRPGRLRAEALRHPAHRRARRRRGAGRAEPLLPHARLQGDAHRAAARRLLPRSDGSAVRERPRARPLALLDEHVPELGARAPVPAASRTTARSTRCAATSTGCARASRSSRRELFGDDLPKVLPVIGAGRLGLGDRSTTCSSCSCSRGRSLPHAMMMMIPEAWTREGTMSRTS